MSPPMILNALAAHADPANRPMIADFLNDVLHSEPGDEGLDERHLFLPTAPHYEHLRDLSFTEYEALKSFVQTMAVRMLRERGEITDVEVKHLEIEIDQFVRAKSVAQDFGRLCSLDDEHVNLFLDCFKRVEMSGERVVRAAGKDCVEKYLNALTADQRAYFNAGLQHYDAQIIIRQQQQLLIDPNDALGEANRILRLVDDLLDRAGVPVVPGRAVPERPSVGEFALHCERLRDRVRRARVMERIPAADAPAEAQVIAYAFPTGDEYVPYNDDEDAL